MSLNPIPLQEYFANAVVAQGLGNEVMILSRLHAPFTRYDGEQAHYVLERRMLTEDCSNEMNPSWASVQGLDQTFWMMSEVDHLLEDIQQGETNLFIQFHTN